MKKDLLLEPRNLAAAVRARLDEIEGLLDKGISRQEIAQLLDSEYSFSVTVKALDMALYRARLKRKKGGLHNPERTVNTGLHNTQNGGSEKGAEESVLHNTQTPPEPEPQGSEKKESPGIIDKEFFNKISEDFDPKMFNKKF